MILQIIGTSLITILINQAISFYQGLEEIQDHCKQNHVSHLIILKHDLDSGFVWLKSFIESKVIDKRGNLGEVLEYIKKYSASKG